MEGATVIFNSGEKITNNLGEVTFEVYAGTWNFTVSKNSFLEENGTFQVNSDTSFHLFLVRTDAEIKFVLKDGVTPINSATVILGEDTLFSSSLGIARFKGLPVAGSYNYLVYKKGYNDVNGTVSLNTDTTLNIAMKSIPVGISDVEINTGLKIWPNPVGANLSVYSDETIEQISVLTITGSKLTIKTKLENGVYYLDFSPFKPGIYLLKINFSNENSVTRKIIRY